METTFNPLSYIKLKLKIDFPELGDSWLDGYESAIKNLSEESNPFPPHSLEFEHWEAGWWDGFFEEQALFNFSDTVTILDTDEVIRRIEQAGSTTFLYSPSASQEYLYPYFFCISAQIRTVFTHLVQCMAAIMAFSFCCQFADFFA